MIALLVIPVGVLLYLALKDRPHPVSLLFMVAFGIAALATVAPEALLLWREVHALRAVLAR